MSNINRLQRTLLCVVVAFAQMVLGQQLRAATFEFSSPSSKLVLGDFNGGATATSSYFKNNARSQLIGWDQQSIIKGNSQSNTFSNAWTFSLGTGLLSNVGVSPITRDLSVTTSDMALVVKGTSQWVFNNATTVRTTSNYVNAFAPIIRTTSNWVNAKDALVRTTSNAVNYYAPTIVGTSHWVTNQADSLRGTSRWVTNNAVAIKGTSQWVFNNATTVRTTSNYVNAFAPIIRTTSNWVNARDPIINAGLGIGIVTVTGATYTLTSPLQLDHDGGALLFATSCAFNGNGNLLRMKQGAIGIVLGFQNEYFTNIIIEPFDPVNYLITPYFGSGVTLVLDYDVTLQQNLNINGAVTLQGNNHQLTLNGYKIVMTENGSLTLGNCIIPDLKGSPFLVTRDSNNIIVDNTELHLSRNVTFTKGALKFVNDVKMTGTSIFSYESSSTSTIATASTLLLDTNITFSYSPNYTHLPGNVRNSLLAMTDVTSMLYMKGSTLKTTTTGISLQAGTMLVDGLTNFYNDGATKLSQAIKLGGTTAATDLEVIVMPSASINLQSGLIDYCNAS